MRFDNEQNAFYCGVDLHTQWMYLCILDQKGTSRFDPSHLTNTRLSRALTPHRPSRHRHSGPNQQVSQQSQKKTGPDSVRSLDSRGQIGVRPWSFISSRFQRRESGALPTS
jgi:hypothetical protein